MKWIVNTLGSSIGKKLLMAFTGLCFCGFLTSHLAGNLIIYSGQSAFNTYAEKLHALGPIITIAELTLLFFAIIHVSTGLILFYQNFTSRPERYVSNKWAGGRTIASASMPYTGIFMLAFIVLHLLDFHFVDKTNQAIYQIVSTTFQSPVYVFIYVAAMILVAVHVSHGLWSSFQSLGVSHSKYSPAIRVISLVFAIGAGLGFGSIPLYLLLK